MFEFLRNMASKPPTDEPVKKEDVFVPANSTSFLFDLSNPQLMEVVYSAVNLIASELAHAQWVTTRREDNGVFRSSPRDNITEVLNTGKGGQHSGFDKKRLVATDLLLKGNAYMRISRTNNGRSVNDGGLIAAIDYLPYADVKLVGKEYRVKGEVLMPPQIVHFRHGIMERNDQGIYCGVSPIKVLRKNLQLLEEGLRTYGIFAKNPQTSNGTLTYPNNVDTPENKTATLEQVKMTLQNLSAQGISAIPSDYAFAPNGTTVNIRELTTLVQEAVCAVYAIPVEALSGKQFDRAKLLHGTVENMGASIASALSREIFPSLEGTQQIRVITDGDLTWNDAKGIAQAGIATIDEIRKMLGLPVMPDGQGAALPRVAGAPPPIAQPETGDNNG